MSLDFFSAPDLPEVQLVFPRISMKNRQDLDPFQCHRSMTAFSFSRIYFLQAQEEKKNVAAAEGTESKFRILLSLSFQIYSPAASVLLGVQLNQNTEGPILPLKFMLRIFFFCDLNSVQLAQENFLSPKLKPYSQNHFHFCAMRVKMTKLESLT